MKNSACKIDEMRAFFTARVDGYDAHMLGHVEGAREGYARVAELLPQGTRTLLDLGCGTGIELGGVFDRFSDMEVTGIDLTQAMLDALMRKYADKRLTLICGDYFQVDFGAERFDAALSFETMHHFTHAEKLGLYQRVFRALRPGGVYIEADYVAATQEEEDALFRNRTEKLAAAAPGLYHIDVPCTAHNQTRLLCGAGFEGVRLDRKWGNTAVIVGEKRVR